MPKKSTLYSIEISQNRHFLTEFTFTRWHYDDPAEPEVHWTREKKYTVHSIKSAGPKWLQYWLNNPLRRTQNGEIETMLLTSNHIITIYPD